MLRHPNQQIMQQAYARWAPVYDVLCGPIFLPGRRAAAARVLVAASSNSAPARAFRFDDYDDGRRDEFLRLPRNRKSRRISPFSRASITIDCLTNVRNFRLPGSLPGPAGAELIERRELKPFGIYTRRERRCRMVKINVITRAR